jgi:hypothetical protein
MKEDAIGPEIHAGALSSQNAVKALLNSSQGPLKFQSRPLKSFSRCRCSCPQAETGPF